jgi:hypothetical protein
LIRDKAINKSEPIRLPELIRRFDPGLREIMAETCAKPVYENRRTPKLYSITSKKEHSRAIQAIHSRSGLGIVSEPQDAGRQP